MCGIVGVIGPELPEDAVAARARDLMRHRGPDDAGSILMDGAWLASRRLAIIDVGEGGHQPLQDEETGVVVVFNGEIFNYIELRSELEGHGHRFRGRSDTEVLLRGYLQWGTTSVERMNGMWAFLIWDPTQHRLFFSRDRFGIKPLFMCTLAGGLAVASEPKVLTELYPSLRRPDDVAVARLLTEKRIYTDERSFYESISVLPAAHWGTFSPGDSAPTLTRFWDFPPEEDLAPSSRDDVEDEFAELLEDSVRIRLRSDVPVGVTLSGGLDSTALLHATRRASDAGACLRAYTAAYADSGADGATVDERSWARLAVSAYEGVHLREVAASSDSLVSLLRRIVWHMDGPGFSPAVLPVWQIVEAAHEDGVKVLLEGQGADELLGGYSSHVAAALLDSLSQAVQHHRLSAGVEALRTARGVPRSFSVRRVLGDMLEEIIAPVGRWDLRRSTVIQALRPELLPAPAPIRVAANDDTHLRRRLLEDFSRELLPGFLHYGDAITMAHSVEARLPFLDHRLVELCFRMPAEYKVRAGQSKAVLRSYLRAAGQGRIAARRRKRGYPTPTNEWLAAGNGAVLRAVLLDPGAKTRAYILPDRLEGLIDRHVSGMVAAGDVLFALLCTELWLQECVHPQGSAIA
jgi:asparagine synthase (glutamine-hydrolysing)